MATIIPTAGAQPSNDPPMAFAVMRNAHEAFRGSIQEMALEIEEGPDAAARFRTLWSEYQRCLNVHMLMEDIDMFPLLTEVNGGVSLNLEHFHVEDVSQVEEIEKKLRSFEEHQHDKASHWLLVTSAWKKWQQDNEVHFKKEEELMMPLTVKVGATPGERCKVAHHKLITPAMNRNAAEFEYFVGFCIKKLSVHGSAQQPANVATRVWARALHSASSAAQWSIFRPIVEQNCTAEQWSEMVATYHLDVPVGDDKIDAVQPTALPAAIPAGDPPMAFAIMRNAHEAFRGAIKEIEKLLIEEDHASSGLFVIAWSHYNRSLLVHMAMEDIDLFPLLTQVNGGVDLGLAHLHPKDTEDVEAVNVAINAFSNEQNDKLARWHEVISTWKNWQQENEVHFKKEEETMMPLTVKVGATPGERCKVAHHKLVTPAMNRNAAEFEYFVGFCIKKLSVHGSAQQPANVATRVWARALHSASSAAQWSIFRPIVEQNCTAEQWSEMVATYHLDVPVGDDKLALSGEVPAAPSIDSKQPATHTQTATAATASFSTNTESNAVSSAAAKDSAGGCCVIS